MVRIGPHGKWENAGARVADACCASFRACLLRDLCLAVRVKDGRGKADAEEFVEE